MSASACHWCHVMERESFDDPSIAAIMNEHYVCIKVDREERPDLDQIYQTVCQLVTGGGGWPLSVWLTPEQKPFYVGTYFPPADRYGRPGFPRVLLGLATAYRERRDEVLRVAENWREAIARLDQAPEPAGSTPGRQLMAEAARAVAARVDRRNGGFGDAPKFPNASALEFLLRHWKASGDDHYLHLVTLSLRKMAQGGIYDQIGGGFHRYAVDAAWRVPHFEKMLYDNATLPPLYLAAWQATGDPLFRRVVEETLDYAIREMRHPEGGFYSATDADSEGEEGKYFVFDPEDVAAAGDELAPLLCRHFGVTAEGNFEATGKTVLHVAVPADALARELGLPPEEVEAKLAEGRRRMLAYRQRRVPPFRDEKILTGWNGLMIRALARAERSLGEPRYTEAAREAADFILERLTEGEGGLLRRFKDGQAGIPAYLEDYAYLTAGLIDLYEATFAERYLQAAVRFARAAIDRFYDGAGSFYLTPAGGEALIHRPKDVADSSTPSGAAVTVMNLLRLIPFTGEERFREVAEAVFRAYAGHMEQMPMAMATLLQALDLYLSGPTEVTLVGPVPGDWLEGLGRLYLPNLVLTRIDGPRDDAPIWAGKQSVAGAPTGYVCLSFACSPPATSWEELAKHLA